MKNYIILILLSAVCFGFVTIKNRDFQIISAVKEDVSGGARNTLPGTSYTLKLKTKYGSEKVKIDQLWIEGVPADVRAGVTKGSFFKEEFISGDTVIVSSIIRKGDDKPSMPELKAPQKGVFVGYMLQGVRKFYKIKQVSLKNGPRRK